ncbi:DUF3078 domain-containing protein [Roseivirga sp. BDSF3-8]|uniref:DUF3078 domain-containing protein n=1 Tax=Roseivirga sp. BDSF3-8 TaxID=3241598 RepID=UPI003531F7B4
MKKLFTAIMLMVLPIAVWAQDDSTEEVDTTWITGGDVALNFSNVSLSNWAGGGQSSISLGGIFNTFAKMEDDRNLWQTDLQLAYGLIKQGDNELRKSDDAILLISQYGYKLTKHWHLSTKFDFRTQFAPGYNFPEDVDGLEQKQLISEFMAPGYLLFSPGITYTKKKFSATLSPATAKWTFVLNDSLATAGAYGVDPEKNVRTQIGMNFAAAYEKEIAKNVTFSTLLNLFNDYETFGLIDVNWETLFIMKVNEWLSTSFTTQLIYDDDIDVIRNEDPNDVGPAVQWKNVLNVGVIVKF